MKNASLLSEFASLPPEAQKQLIEFIAFLKTKYPLVANQLRKKTGELTDEPFIGMWRDREDMKDSSQWVRETRRKEWQDLG